MFTKLIQKGFFDILSSYLYVFYFFGLSIVIALDLGNTSALTCIIGCFASLELLFSKVKLIKQNSLDAKQKPQ